MDNSKLDKQYFIDDQVFNCPFCNRNNVKFNIVNRIKYDFSNNKEATVFFTRCSSCGKTSMHSSFNIELKSHPHSHLYYIKKEYVEDIDSHIFHSQPTSFFTIDTRIPRVLRELITESEGCLKMNFLTGASACARKAIYELLINEKVKGNNYDEKIKKLKTKYQNIDEVYFDILLHIKDMTSEKVHEQSWKKWNSKYLKLILETLKSIFVEIYVVPQKRTERKKVLEELRNKIQNKE